MAAEGRGEQEKGHRWAEALSSVKVLKVNRVSVKLTPDVSPSSNQCYVTGCLWPPQLCHSSLRAVIPTCWWTQLFTCLNILAAYCTL